MSASPACDGSTIETTFVVGPDLVEFDRPDLPIYAPLETRWADAGLDTCTYGQPLDRLFGEPGPIFVSAASGIDQPAAAVVAVVPAGEDPLVALGTLSDGLVLPVLETPADHHQPVATIFDAGIDSFAAVHLPADGAWNADTWSFDYGT
jgi:hypothetical protein